MSEKYIFVKLNSLLNVTQILRTVCDAVIKGGRREETSMFAAFSGCTYNNEVCLSA